MISDKAQRRYGLSLLDLAVGTCRKTFQFESDAHICTSSSYHQSECFGQPGGPLFVFEKKVPILIGIAHVFLEDGCMWKNSIVFSRVENYLSWIESITITF